MSALAFHDVACVRAGRVLFEGLGFALGPGDALYVTGANGAGKSSLIRIAAGLLEAAAGRVVRAGDVALADEATALDAELPLARALQFWARMDGRDAREAMAAMGLAPLAEVPVRLLSTGQRKRAVLARTIASGAPIWLLDEPANGLDAAGVALIETHIAAHRAGGGAVVVATHLPMTLPDAQELAL